MRIYIGTDHAGFELKEKLVVFLRELGHDVEDMGAHSFEALDDYPDFIRPVAEAVAHDPQSRGIILGGSGQGEAMCANRVKGARAAVYYGGAVDIVVLSREHNDANILSLGARFVETEEAKEVVRVWLETPFSGAEKHARRIAKLDK
ncbi:MAG: ribose-5-phosphate isomerase [Candidatus Yonathbacteria bacterium CG17_big_fil_post_rev_8_21_14_2_50_43_9]|uniref:Ribose-5-phosphate isomerase n=1 Tax=Candidatus Yonathbacteria bacterium CG_4_10_14_0_8_um_filter_43_17 TaxID=1975099 RepID=A0A2M7Q720_9BACT|nr:MAG: ribose-5-phosphate isomerase [Candidatus Yonathbacteria bacterium CG17_big_fil_post_rev_8_21_14_2_50_43_9]PIX57179.1 MAG: ribose-5-phosphate isomerase [Candidatus Yonathbacteria bacterium CG_4_10_14_3_um_filter_43_12]PIY58774.1 MAG: ribose-5-phosphate isomerase [Candidatus Yonathbacteria bacterium CG_4_10_14_0_8_um_filter_43_17]